MQLKKFYRPLSWMFCLFVFITACTENDQQAPAGNGSIQFSLGGQVNGRQKSEEPLAVRLTITDANGHAVKEFISLPLDNFNGSYVSQPLELPVGSYKLTDFLVLGAENKVLYVAPKEGSELAPFVTTPLPLAFSVTHQNTTALHPEVVEVTETTTPEQFGYATFDFSVVRIFDVEMNIIVNGVPVSGVVHVDGKNATGETVWSIEYSVVANEPNKMLIKSGFEHYEFTLKAQDLTRTFTFTETELKANPELSLGLAEDDYYTYVTSDNNVTLRLAKDATNPYFEISVVDKDKVNFLSIDRVFWLGEVQASDYVWIGQVALTGNHYADNTSFAFSLDYRETKGITWDNADAVLIYSATNGHEEEITHVWDYRPATGRHKAHVTHR